MQDPNNPREPVADCHKQDCPGGLEGRLIRHTTRYKGKIAVIDHVPAEVCDFCGEALFAPDTVRRIERIIEGLDEHEPASTVPLYELGESYGGCHQPQTRSDAIRPRKDSLNRYSQRARPKTRARRRPRAAGARPCPARSGRRG